LELATAAETPPVTPPAAPITPPIVPRATSREMVTKIAELVWIEAAMAMAPRIDLKETMLTIARRILRVIEVIEELSE
jgi:hypothetical protein